MSPAVQKGPLGDLHANGPSPREERVEGTPRRLTQGATALGRLAPSTLSSRPRGVTCAEIGIVAKIAAANSRPMTDHVFIVFLLVFNAIKEDHCPTKNSNPRQQEHTSGRN
jgi:hypothetical protein